MERAPPPPDDLQLKEYIKQLRKRLTNMENELKHILESEHQEEEKIERVRGELKVKMKDAQEEVQRINDNLTRVMKETTKLVGEFKNCVRTPRFSKLQQRVDVWKGEQYITRERLKRLIRESIENT